MKKKSRRFLSLIELFIAMALTVVLLTALTYFYQQVTQYQETSERIQRDLFQAQYAENRLLDTLSKACAEYSPNISEFYFFTSGNMNGLLDTHSPSLIFLFDNEVDVNTEQATIQLGRIFLDHQKRLCLAMFSDPDDWKRMMIPPVHKEILLDNVESLSFSFYIAPPKNRNIIVSALWRKKEPPVDAMTAAPGWVSEWSRERKYLPYMMQVVVTRKLPNKDEAEKIVFAIPLPNSMQIPVYEQGS